MLSLPAVDQIFDHFPGLIHFLVFTFLLFRLFPPRDIGDNELTVPSPYTVPFTVILHFFIFYF